MGKDRLPPGVNTTQRLEVDLPEARIPDRTRLEASMEIYARVVQGELPVLQRPEFQIPPRKRRAIIS